MAFIFLRFDFVSISWLRLVERQHFLWAFLLRFYESDKNFWVRDQTRYPLGTWGTWTKGIQLKPIGFVEEDVELNQKTLFISI